MRHLPEVFGNSFLLMIYKRSMLTSHSKNSVMHYKKHVILGVNSSQKHDVKFLTMFPKARPDGPRSLVWVVARAFCWPLLLMVFPRLCLIGFNYAQPFLITSLMDLLSQPDDIHTRNKGYGLVGGAALVYFGTAIRFLV
jgi:hypothetical protein